VILSYCMGLLALFCDAERWGRTCARRVVSKGA
jgi:hypothetical protein